MAGTKAKKGPRQKIGLKCSVCDVFGYITNYNKNNEQLKTQAGGEKTFPLKKYCKKCMKHTEHKISKKLK